MDETAIRSPDEILQALRDCYCGHMLKLEQADAVRSIGEVFSGWLGGGGRRKQARSEALTAFHGEAGALVEALLDALTEYPEQAERGAAGAMEIILFYPPKQGRAVDLALAAVEGLAEPLIPYLDREAAAELVQRYRRRTPPRMMLPNQKALFEKLRAQGGVEK